MVSDEGTEQSLNKTRKMSREVKRYVVEMCFLFEHRERQTANEIRYYFDFGTEKNYQLYSANNFDTLNKLIKKDFLDDYHSYKSYRPCAISMPEVTKEVIVDLITLLYLKDD